jgi:hypothetical protein
LWLEEKEKLSVSYFSLRLNRSLSGSGIECRPVHQVSRRCGEVEATLLPFLFFRTWA